MPPDADERAGAIVDIWFWSLAAELASLAACSALLSADETLKASRFVHERDRRRYIVGRGRLRLILSDYCRTDPAELLFRYNDQGKPSLAPEPELSLYFNLSHSADLAALAVCDGYEVGIDIEEIGALKEDIASRVFSAGERAVLDALPSDGYLDGFYRCWTRKEAFVKAHGAGLTFPLDAIDITLADNAVTTLERAGNNGQAAGTWTILSLEVPGNFAGALAVRADGLPVRLRYRRDE